MNHYGRPASALHNPTSGRTAMRGYIRWGTVLAMLGGLTVWVRRRRRNKALDPHTLGTVSEQWFMDRRYDL